MSFPFTKTAARKTIGRVLGAFAGFLLVGSIAPAGPWRDDDERRPYRVEHPWSRRAGGDQPSRFALARAEYRAQWAEAHAAYLEWSLRHRNPRVVVPRWVRLESFNGLLPRTPLVRYLEWRRGLDRIRFDHYHPFWAPQLAADEAIRTAFWLKPPPALALNPPKIAEPINPLGSPAHPEPQFLTTPEPTSGTALAFLTGLASLLVRWKSRMTSAPKIFQTVPDERPPDETNS